MSLPSVHKEKKKKREGFPADTNSATVLFELQARTNWRSLVILRPFAVFRKLGYSQGIPICNSLWRMHLGFETVDGSLWRRSVHGHLRGEMKFVPWLRRCKRAETDAIFNILEIAIWHGGGVRAPARPSFNVRFGSYRGFMPLNMPSERRSHITGCWRSWKYPRVCT